jgi:hypothetical protein
MGCFVRRPVLLMITVVPLLYTSGAWSDPAFQPIKSFLIQGPSVQFLLNGQPVESGPITASLAPSDTPATGPDSRRLRKDRLERVSNVYGLDEAAGTAILDVTLRIQFPLLAVINQPPPTIRIVEEGPFTLVNTTAGQFVDAALEGGGTIQDGSIFDGVLYASYNRDGCSPTRPPEGPVPPIMPVPPVPLACVSGVQIPLSTVPGHGFLIFPPDLGGQTISLEGSHLRTPLACFARQSIASVMAATPHITLNDVVVPQDHVLKRLVL